MLKLISFIGAAVFALTAATAALAGDTLQTDDATYVPGRDARAALFQLIAHKPCCYNNGRFANSTPKTCYRYGGRIVAYEYCERQSYGWNNGPYQGQWSNNYGGYSADKPCCFNRGQYFNSTPKTCRRYGGQTVPQEYCAYAYGYQNGPYNHDGYNQRPW
jgi:hypothetical protein